MKLILAFIAVITLIITALPFLEVLSGMAVSMPRAIVRGGTPRLSWSGENRGIGGGVSCGRASWLNWYFGHVTVRIENR